MAILCSHILGCTIHRCGLNCQPQWHYYCMYCESMLYRNQTLLNETSVLVWKTRVLKLWSWKCSLQFCGDLILTSNSGTMLSLSFFTPSRFVCSRKTPLRDPLFKFALISSTVTPTPLTSSINTAHTHHFESPHLFHPAIPLNQSAWSEFLMINVWVGAAFLVWGCVWVGAILGRSRPAGSAPNA